MSHVEEGKRLVEKICKVMEWDGVRDLICECFADGAEFTNMWAEGWSCSMKPTGEQLKEYKKCECLEDKLAYLWYIDSLTFIDIEEDNPVNVTLDGFYEGVAKMKEDAPNLFGQFLDESFDGITCDALLQYAVYGEYIYG